MTDKTFNCVLHWCTEQRRYDLHYAPHETRQWDNTVWDDKLLAAAQVTKGGVGRALQTGGSFVRSGWSVLGRGGQLFICCEHDVARRQLCGVVWRGERQLRYNY